MLLDQLLHPMRCHPCLLPSLVVSLAAGCGQMSVQPPSPAKSSPVATSSRPLRLASGLVAFHTRDVNYLQVDGKTFQATVYQPEGPGPFPAILSVHGGAWVGNVRRDANAPIDKTLAGMGMVVAAIDFRQSPQHHYPDSVADVNFAIRWLRANASKFNASPQIVGAFGSSSGGHLVLLNGMRPVNPRYGALPWPGSRGTALVLVQTTLSLAGRSHPLARRAYAQQVGNNGPVKSTDIYFSPAGSIQDGNPQLILERHESVKLPPILLLQGSADANGVVHDKNVSPEIQRRFAAAYQAAGGKIQLELFPGAPHGFANMPGPNPDRAFRLMKIFIEQQLAGQ